jgi:excisionase family DNA binding protein
MPRPMTPEEAGELIGINPRTLTKWAREGRCGLPAHPMGDGRRRVWRFFEAELIQWLTSQKNGKAVTHG